MDGDKYKHVLISSLFFTFNWKRKRLPSNKWTL